MADTPITLRQLAFCEHAFIDAKGRLCLIGMMDDMVTDALPLTIERAAVAARHDSHFPFDIQLNVHHTDEQGQTVNLSGTRTGIAEVSPGVAIFRIYELTLPKPGKYQFILIVNGRIGFSMDVTLRVETPSAGPTFQGPVH